VALKQPSGPELVRALHEVQQVAQSAASLSQQLLAFGRRQALQPRVLGLNRICERSLRMLRRLIGENVEIRFLPASDLRPVRADPSGLEQILMNLSVNARDAMPHGGAMTVSTANAALETPRRVGEETLPAGDYVLLSVTDTGIGMDEGTRRQIFEPFFTTKELGKGTGLGLSVVYGVVRQSGGAVAVDSTPGGGSTFTVYLPATDGPYDVDVPLTSAPEPARGSENILLVEDDDAVRNATASYLSAAGYVVQTASSGAAALEIAGDGGPEIELLLTDVILPGLTGPQIAQTLTARNPRLRVLYLSGHPRDALALDAPLPPRTAFIQKPIPLRDLLREVRALLDVR
jgi:CheY-like chemotaxis protein